MPKHSVLEHSRVNPGSGKIIVLIVTEEEILGMSKIPTESIEIIMWLAALGYDNVVTRKQMSWKAHKRGEDPRTPKTNSVMDRLYKAVDNLDTDIKTQLSVIYDTQLKVINNDKKVKQVKEE